jgi:hypothetical protein
LKTHSGINLKFTKTLALQLTYFVATLISLSSEAFNASACHGSQRQTVIHLALCILNTWLEGCARVLAISSVVGNDAGLFAWTLFVHLTTQVFNHRLRN